ncbi:Hypothetical predicted protein [Olea europaea subsp. europaea]|uniref:Uncharacterized protein n=1 Tax=Olea europaea subsp. europaea TaxID=158383 RepID=A0A8S0QH80_OLEEU|nr:Hypothetical predicted protein [Olea europaea subsp. europaea]
MLKLPDLRYLDIRFNNFEGPLLPELFNKHLKAIFVNHNRFHSTILENFSYSPASVPFSNNALSGGLPELITLLNGTNVIDICNKKLIGDLPVDLAYLQNMEVVDMANNMFRGKIPDSICSLPNLKNLSSNYFVAKDQMCQPNEVADVQLDDKTNCLGKEAQQRSEKVCQAVLSKSVNCSAASCRALEPNEGPKRQWLQKGRG